MAVGDVAKLVFHFTLGGSQLRPGLHFQSTTALSTLQSLIDSWQATCQTQMLTAMSQAVQLVGYEAQDKVPGVAATLFEAVSPALPGLHGEDALPGQDAVGFGLKTSLKSRRARGRVYWAGAIDTAATGGTLAPAGLAEWQALATAMTTNYLGHTPSAAWHLCNFSPEQLTAPPPPPTFTPRPGHNIHPV